MTSEPSAFQDLYFTSRDGLRLHARHYRSGGSTRRPAVCLPGLTRNARDFHKLASVLSDPRGHRRDVYCIDYRGRGLSEHAADPMSYTVKNELDDVLDFMTMTGIHDAAIVGTSRGGLVAMAMAAARPSAMGVCVLNDIGPVIERDGLARIVAYVGRVPLPATWAAATELVRSISRQDFPKVTDAEWDEIARQMFNDQDGYPVFGYDTRLSQALSLSDGALPELWPQFGALARVAVLAIRGSRSDILSAKTLADMQLRHPHLATFTVDEEGHSPMLRDVASIGAIYEFLIRNDREADVRTHGRPAPIY